MQLTLITSILAATLAGSAAAINVKYCSETALNGNCKEVTLVNGVCRKCRTWNHRTIGFRSNGLCALQRTSIWTKTTRLTQPKLMAATVSFGRK